MIAGTSYGCAHLIYQTWNKWNYNPVIVSFDDKMTSISEIPFPAITICPESKTNPSKFNYTDICKKVFNNESLTEWE